MEKVVVTIARQYGSGGKTIGKMLAKELDIPYYNREILRMASDDSGINEQLFAAVDERLKTRLRRVAQKVYSGELLPPDSNDFISTDNLFNYQAKILKQLAEEESYIAIGRCADFVLKDYPHVVSVFIHAPAEFCLEQAMNTSSKSREEMKRFIAKTDKYRGDYYKYHTGQEWYDARNYDLCLDSSKLGFQGCVDAVKAYMKVRGLL